MYKINKRLNNIYILVTLYVKTKYASEKYVIKKKPGDFVSRKKKLKFFDVIGWGTKN